MPRPAGRGMDHEPARRSSGAALRIAKRSNGGRMPMAEQAGSLSFGFEADFSGFTRAADSAGATLDRLAGRADAFAQTSSASLAPPRREG